ncbi:MAG TPA: glycosyltransferase [Candidatus Eisenbacteria bacterium]|nr:glycosyltransferase [Candidatus Eisenbacteria bacterium]
MSEGSPGRAAVKSDAAHLPLLAAQLARAHGHRAVIGVGRITWGETRLAYPDLELVELVPGDAAGRATRERSTHRRLGWDATRPTPPVADALLGASAVAVILDGPRDAPGPSASAHAERVLAPLLDRAPLTIVVAPGSPDELRSRLAALGAEPTLLGRGPGSRVDGASPTAIAIVDRAVPAATPAPSSLRIMAVMTAYNEADIIGPSIEGLLGAGLAVHVIDNWSTDGTYEIAERYRGDDAFQLERFPDAPTPSYDWAPLLRRVETVGGGARVDWAIHNDADERRTGPWPELALRDAIWRVQGSGFDAINHTRLDYRPIDNDFVPGTDFAAYFRHFEFGTTPDLRRLVKAWRNTGQHVDLAGTAGHEAAFPGRRLFPYRFLLHHYPVRSQAHGERKVLRERQARWNAAERAKGWHVHYDAIAEGHAFVRPVGELIEFVDGRTERDLVVPISSGIGLFPSGVPSWATGGPLRAATYRLGRTLGGGSATRGFRSAVRRLPIVGRPARWAWRRLMGVR